MRREGLNSGQVSNVNGNGSYWGKPQKPLKKSKTESERGRKKLIGTSSEGKKRTKEKPLVTRSPSSGGKEISKENGEEAVARGGDRSKTLNLREKKGH